MRRPPERATAQFGAMRRVSRRGLLGLGAAVIAGAGGAGAGWLTAPTQRIPPPPPPKRAPVLEAELARERALLAQLESAASVESALAARIAVLRADHVEHVTALEGLLSAVGVSPVTSVSPAGRGPTPTPTSTPSPAPSSRPAATVADLRTAEAAAAIAAAAASARLSGAAAATLASISASESAHAAWLA